MTLNSFTPTTYLYRRGDGNDGNFARYYVTLKPSDNPYAALRALIANDYISTSATRRHIIRNVEIDGEAQFGISAMVYEDRNGDGAYGAAWLTAELQPCEPDFDPATDTLFCYPLRKVLDSAALKLYHRNAKHGLRFEREVAQ